MKHLRCFLVCLPLAGSIAVASDGLVLVGSSLKQLAVGGAVTANPLTPMTAITNPAGLWHVDKQIDVSMEFAFLNLDAKFNAMPGLVAQSERKFQLIPSLGMMAPTKNERVRIGLGTGLVAGSGTDFSWPSLNRASSSDLQVIRIAPAVAYKVDDKTSVGVAAHMNVGRVAMSNPGFGASSLPAAFAHGAELVGFGAGLGVMYEPTEKLTVGASYQSDAGFPTASYGGQTGNFRGKFDLPQQAALGVAYKATDKLTVNADYKWINWEKKLKDLWIYGPGLPDDGVNLHTNWNDQYVLALGLVYEVSPGFMAMAGYNHCTAPFADKDASKNLLLPAITRNHYSIGFTWENDEQWTIGLVGILSAKNEVSDGAVTLETETFTLGFNATVRF